MKRPAEVTTAGAGLAFLIAYLLGATDDPAVLAALGIVLSAIPGAVTGLVEWRRKRRLAGGTR